MQILEDPALTCVAVGGDGRQAGVIADARALDMGLRVGRLHLAGVVRLRGLAVVALHRVLLGAAHGYLIIKVLDYSVLPFFNLVNSIHSLAIWRASWPLATDEKKKP